MWLVAEDDPLLGSVTCAELDATSFLNPFGAYGSEFSPTSIWNELSPYGSPTGPYSACNSFTRRPPRLVDATGCAYGRFGLNAFVVDSVCGLRGDAELCATLQAICAP